MITPKDIIGHLHGGRALDVATGSGSFIHFLLEGLPAYTEIIGLDASERAAAAFAKTFADRPAIRFVLGDAMALSFETSSFDLVCIANSLHHFDEPAMVLAQMLRVLRPGGYLLVAEMVCDRQTETQLTHVYLHHWWAAIDSLSGITHHETYQREALVAMVKDLELEGLALYDLADTSEDPKDPAILTQLDPVFERYTQRASGHPELQAWGTKLRERVLTTGFHSATTLIALGSKSHARTE
ncbi:MAG: class I SAM-dependent methyltransferase [Anaerolineae bacterium]|nr:class I SAM-dependent methyltransferase [Anaerolineae bacterium]